MSNICQIVDHCALSVHGSRLNSDREHVCGMVGALVMILVNKALNFYQSAIVQNYSLMKLSKSSLTLHHIIADIYREVASRFFIDKEKNTRCNMKLNNKYDMKLWVFLLSAMIQSKTPKNLTTNRFFEHKKWNGSRKCFGIILWQIMRRQILLLWFLKGWGKFAVPLKPCFRPRKGNTWKQLTLFYGNLLTLISTK